MSMLLVFKIFCYLIYCCAKLLLQYHRRLNLSLYFPFIYKDNLFISLWMTFMKGLIKMWCFIIDTLIYCSQMKKIFHKLGVFFKIFLHNIYLLRRYRYISMVKFPLFFYFLKSLKLKFMFKVKHSQNIFWNITFMFWWTDESYSFTSTTFTGIFIVLGSSDISCYSIIACNVLVKYKIINILIHVL